MNEELQLILDDEKAAEQETMDIRRTSQNTPRFALKQFKLSPNHLQVISSWATSVLNF